MKIVVAMLIVLATPRALAQPAPTAQPTWLVGARIGGSGSVAAPATLSTTYTWDNIAPLAHVEGGRYVSERTAIVAGVMGVFRLRGHERAGGFRELSRSFGAATVAAERHAGGLFVGAGAGVAMDRTYGAYPSPRTTYGPVFSVRGGAQIPAGPLWLVLVGDISALRFGTAANSNEPTGSGLAFSVSVGIRAHRTR